MTQEPLTKGAQEIMVRLKAIMYLGEIVSALIGMCKKDDPNESLVRQVERKILARDASMDVLKKIVP